jgi:hypothetical protein
MPSHSACQVLSWQGGCLMEGLLEGTALGKLEP